MRGFHTTEGLRVGPSDITGSARHYQTCRPVSGKLLVYNLKAKDYDMFAYEVETESKVNAYKLFKDMKGNHNV